MTGSKPPVYVLVGLPGSGKSTWAKNHPDKLPVASTDAFIDAFAEENGLTYGEAFPRHFPEACRQMKRQVEEGYIPGKTPFIWDQGNLFKKERESIYRLLHPTHRVIFVVFDTPLDTCLERYRARERDMGAAVDESRIRMLAAAATFPGKDDLSDEVIYVSI